MGSFPQRRSTIFDSCQVIDVVYTANVANAEQKNAQADIDRLKIKTAFVDNGPVMKRMEPRSMGRANVIRKRSCHITIILSED
jgi:large subunit ribosomal protein L22